MKKTKKETEKNQESWIYATFDNPSGTISWTEHPIYTWNHKDRWETKKEEIKTIINQKIELYTKLENYYKKELKKASSQNQIELIKEIKHEWRSCIEIQRVLEDIKKDILDLK